MNTTRIGSINYFIRSLIFMGLIIWHFVIVVGKEYNDPTYTSGGIEIWIPYLLIFAWMIFAGLPRIIDIGAKWWSFFFLAIPAIGTLYSIYLLIQKKDAHLESNKAGVGISSSSVSRNPTL